MRAERLAREAQDAKQNADSTETLSDGQRVNRLKNYWHARAAEAAAEQQQ